MVSEQPRGCGFRRVLLIIGILTLVFCAGGYLGQATFEPQVIIEHKTLTIYQVIEKVVPIEKVIVERVEVPVKLRDFETLEKLEQWLEETGIRVQFGGNLFDCDNYALGLQQKAINDGYLMSFEAIRADEYNKLFKANKLTPGELHAINSVIIGNDVYYIEPQTREVVLVGHLD